MPVRILLADDHIIFREGLCALINRHPGMEVVGEADDGLDAVQMAKTLLPHVVIMDVTMPEMSGIDATRKIVGELPSIRVIGLSIHSDRRFVSGMLDAGASGYLLKDCDYGDLIRAIVAVMANRKYLCAQIAEAVLIDGGYGRYNHRKKTSELTRREYEVLRHWVEGMGSAKSAALLNLSIKTIETHRRNIKQKLNLRSIADLIKYAVREGLTTLDEGPGRIH